MGQRNIYNFIKSYSVPFGGGRVGADVLAAETKKLEGIYGQKVESLEELKRSVLQKAFSGEL